MTDQELADKLNRTFRAAKYRRGNILGLHRKDYPSFHSIEEAINLFKDNDYTLLSEEYKSCHKKLKYICNKHKERGVQEITLSHLINGEGCRYCGFQRTAKAKMLPDSHYIEWCTKNNCTYKGRYVKHSLTWIQFECNKHVNLGIQEKSIANLESTCGCPHCKSSKGENSVESFLILHNISYERQKRFENCKYKYTLPFDFYLPDMNTVIEYDGQHHFQPTPYNGNIETAKEEFKLTQIRDNIKNNYCKENEITIIRIPYYENDIESFLLEKMKQLRKVS